MPPCSPSSLISTSVDTQRRIPHEKDPGAACACHTSNTLQGTNGKMPPLMPVRKHDLPPFGYGLPYQRCLRLAQAFASCLHNQRPCDRIKEHSSTYTKGANGSIGGSALVGLEAG